MSTMNEVRFHDLVDAVQQQVEDAFDDSGLDLDLENAGGVLTVRFENGSQLILSRQAPLCQLWVAAKSGGFHFDYDETSGLWRHDASREPLGALLNRATLEQGGEDVEFPGL
ncbi:MULTISPECIES: iron donor protein CyaY [Pseudomonas aeruginosa group]|nr:MULTISPECIES: iron donor protein CyaY [Pseudomonas aeruginosa group]VTS46530.1 frataxin-like protein [Streptococcus dysgalactiae subsp. equisimilis]AVR70431.1 iron donor protein CyaY [Pseudomonas paraeruginosa]KAB0743382.1 iron donor protein CyaY [Pseudomonas aeruginosa]KPD28810.1 frataxin [Pseudomonas paraeruginosa]KQB31810.1 iron donor protein CyaY [Pseudomonas paraeruginosa]